MAQQVGGGTRRACLDLYGDLIAESREEETREREEKVKKQQLDLQGKLDAALEKIKTLEPQNETLERNISCLYYTAKEEIKRKDFIIADLRKQLSWKINNTKSNRRV